MHHWALHDGTVESLSAVPVFFSGGVSRGQGTKSEQIFPSPAAQSFLINWRKHCVFCASGNFGSGSAGLRHSRVGPGHVGGARSLIDRNKRLFLLRPQLLLTAENGLSLFF